MSTPLPRSSFPVTTTHRYLNHAGTAPLPREAVAAMTRQAQEASAAGSLAVDGHEQMADEVRAAAARLMGVPTADVAFVKNTTEGLGFVANGLTWAPGDRVVVPDREFPSTIYPWTALRDLGVQVDLVAPRGEGWALPVEAFAEVIAAGPPPRVVATSWVQFSRGWRTDLAALAEVTHAAGALLCADVIQGLGVIPAALEAWGVDFAMADAHKWMLGPEGIGVLYVRRSCLELLRPLEPGWASVAHRESWENRELIWADDARRFEGGTANHVGTAGMGASLAMLESAGVDAVWAHVDALCDRAVAGLTEAGATVVSDRSPAGCSGIVTFTVPGIDALVVHDALGAAGVVTSPRGGGARLSPHAYNTTEEIDALVEAVERLG
ncbi:MAG TPA: aminotransferase class V-fold PLP-dependent enzyme [Acidimicrobiales bacterium]|nr:aminotransferase class V-fold PLP-dependent enzyme [Acidimicrobiales bacterium]